MVWLRCYIKATGIGCISYYVSVIRQGRKALSNHIHNKENHHMFLDKYKIPVAIDVIAGVVFVIILASMFVYGVRSV